MEQEMRKPKSSTRRPAASRAKKDVQKPKKEKTRAQR